MIEPTSRPVGAAPLFRQLAEEIGVVSIVNPLVTWDPRQCRVSPGERILLLMLDILTGKTLLYRLAERLTLTDVELVIGQGRRPDDFTDDSLGRALDKLARAGPANIFSAWALAASAQEGMALTTGHFDTTSRSVTGAFADADAALVHPASGDSKDRRPDLKPRLMTLFVNHEGVPLFGTVESGHRSDKTLNTARIDRLVEALSPAELQGLIYVADSALVTSPNLARLERAGIQFVSRCPETFAAVAAAKAAAWAADAGIPVGRLAVRADGATSWASEQSGVIDGRSYRLLVYRSSAHDPRPQRAVDRAIHRGGARHLRPDCAPVSRRDVGVCRRCPDCLRPRFRHGGHRVASRVGHGGEPRASDAARPRKTAAAADTVTTWHVVPTVDAVDETRRAQAIAQRSAFVLITTVPADRLSAAALLAEDQGPSPCGAPLSLLEGSALCRRARREKAGTPRSAGLCVARGVPLIPPRGAPSAAVGNSHSVAVAPGAHPTHGPRTHSPFAGRAHRPRCHHGGPGHRLAGYLSSDAPGHSRGAPDVGHRLHRAAEPCGAAVIFSKKILAIPGCGCEKRAEPPE
ncbi:MAG: DUF4277 domain-containing protein [Firmicutes bacterium]|nr:DUF4277 domain-containing protein [Bacillota bacterium]